MPIETASPIHVANALNVSAVACDARAHVHGVQDVRNVRHVIAVSRSMSRETVRVHAAIVANDNADHYCAIAWTS